MKFYSQRSLDHLAHSQTLSGRLDFFSLHPESLFSLLSGYRFLLLVLSNFPSVSAQWRSREAYCLSLKGIQGSPSAFLKVSGQAKARVGGLWCWYLNAQRAEYVTRMSNLCVYYFITL